MTKQDQIKKLQAILRRSRQTTRRFQDLSTALAKRNEGLKWALNHGFEDCLVEHDCRQMMADAIFGKPGEADIKLLNKKREKRVCGSMQNLWDEMAGAPSGEPRARAPQGKPRKTRKA